MKWKKIVIITIMIIICTTLPITCKMLNKNLFNSLHKNIIENYDVKMYNKNIDVKYNLTNEEYNRKCKKINLSEKYNNIFSNNLRNETIKGNSDLEKKIHAASIKIDSVGYQNNIYKYNNEKEKEKYLKNHNLVYSEPYINYDQLDNNIIICGHYNGIYGIGLNRLHEIKINDEIQIEFKDKKEIYKVVCNEEIYKKEIDTYTSKTFDKKLNYDGEDIKTLMIITCSYTDRKNKYTVITANLKENK